MRISFTEDQINRAELEAETQEIPILDLCNKHINAPRHQ